MSPRPALALACLFLGACERAPLSGPPQIKLGRDQCAQCGMIISEERFAGAILVQDAAERRYLLFDDIGDMLDLELHSPAPAVLERWVHDHDAARGWIAAEKAQYVLAEGLATPMGSGIVACEDRPRADTLAKTKSGRVLRWDELRASRTQKPSGK